MNKIKYMKKFIMKLFGYKLFCTHFITKNVVNGEMEKYCGKYIYAKSFEEAQNFCNKNFPYLKVDGYKN